jgi:glycine cleavage system H protein
MGTERRYSESHEWFDIADDVVTIGLTQYAVNELTDVTYIEIRPTGTALAAGDTIGEVESVKTTSDVYTVVDGEIIEVNQAAMDDPAMLNRDAGGEGWLVKLRTTDASPIDGLLDQSTYDGRYAV